jgi:hypothetical protein
MAVNRDQLFAELEALSEDEIETGLDAGVWGEDKHQLVADIFNPPLMSASHSGTFNPGSR